MGCAQSSTQEIVDRGRKMDLIKDDSPYDEKYTLPVPIKTFPFNENSRNSIFFESQEASEASPRKSSLLLGITHPHGNSLVSQISRKASMNSQYSTFSRASFIASNTARIDETYRISGRQIGSGAYGSVRQGVNRVTGQVRAIKTVLKRSTTNSQYPAAQIVHEMKLMSRLDHPNIIKLFETFEDSRNIYIIMELCSGGELFECIIDSGNFSEKVAAIVFKQMISGINYMHSVGICHRDLKPENFLLAERISDLTKVQIKIIDFGLSASFVKAQKMRTRVCTPYYVAPEVLRGSYDEKCDVWSSGVILYVMLSGYPPFDGDTDAEVLRAIAKGSYSFSGEEWKFVSKEVQGLIRRMFLAPEIRASAADCLQDKWVVEQAPSAFADEGISTSALSNLQKFNTQNQLKKMALTVIASNLDDSKISQLKQMFIKLDADGDGTLDAGEIASGFTELGISIPENLESLLAEVDSDGSGKIDYSEFLASTIDKVHYTQEDACWAAFRVFDIDGNGKITRDELAAILNGDCSLPDNAQEALQCENIPLNNLLDIDRIMEEVDQDGDGEIDFEEFMIMMRRG